MRGLWVVAVTLASLAVGWEEAAKLPAKPVTVWALVEGMTCERCARSLSEALQKVKGVVRAEAFFKEKRVVFVLDERKTPLSALRTVKTSHHTFHLTPLLPIARADLGKAVQALKAVKGVKEAKVVDDGVAVVLGAKETVRYSDLLAALQKAGVSVGNFSKQSPGDGKNGQDGDRGGLQEGGCCG